MRPSQEADQKPKTKTDFFRFLFLAVLFPVQLEAKTKNQNRKVKVLVFVKRPMTKTSGGFGQPKSIDQNLFFLGQNRNMYICTTNYSYSFVVQTDTLSFLQLTSFIMTFCPSILSSHFNLTDWAAKGHMNLKEFMVAIDLEAFATLVLFGVTWECRVSVFNCIISRPRMSSDSRKALAASIIFSDVTGDIQIKPALRLENWSFLPGCNAQGQLRWRIHWEKSDYLLRVEIVIVWPSRRNKIAEPKVPFLWW